MEDVTTESNSRHQVLANLFYVWLPGSGRELDEVREQASRRADEALNRELCCQYLKQLSWQRRLWAFRKYPSLILPYLLRIREVEAVDASAFLDSALARE